jgi:Protein of unknown function (DUF2946)
MNWIYSRIASYCAVALIVLQSLLPLTGELLAQNGLIASDSMQMLCSSTGIKFVKIATLSSDARESHTFKCPWCQLDDPRLVPLAKIFTLHRADAASVEQNFEIPRSNTHRWLLGPARAPPAANQTLA